MSRINLPILAASFALASLSLTAGAASPTAEIPNGTFENGAKVPDHWQIKGDVSLDANDKVEGGHSLHFKRDAVHLPDTEAVSDKFAISPGVWEFTGSDKYDLNSPDVSYDVTVEFDFFDAAGHALKQKRLIVASEKSNWAKFKERFDVPPGTAQAAVDIRYNKTHGDFLIDGLALQYVGASVPMEGGDRRTVFSTNRDGFLFYPGDSVTIAMELNTPVELAGDKLGFTWELTDYWGERQAAPQKGTLTPDGKAENGWNKYHAVLDLTKLPVETGPYYEVHTSVDLGAASPARDFASFAVLPDPITRKYDAKDIPFGAHTWTTTIYEFYPLSARLGLRHTLAFWRWPNTPPYTPEYDSGSEYDSRLGWAKKFGMTPWGGLYPLEYVEHGTGKPYSDEALREGIRQSIEKYSAKDGLWAFQIGNEPPSWNPEGVKADVHAYQVVYDEIKKVNPQIVAIGSAIGPNEAFFQAGFQKYQDAYNIHAYSDLGELRAQMQKYRELFKKYGGEKPIWSTEIGSKGQGLPRDVIAKDIVRKVVCFFADGGGFFTWFATGGMPDPDGERAGSYSDSMDLFDSKYNMYMARIDAVSYYHIVNALCVKKFVKEIDYPNGVDGFLFRDKDGNDLIAFWGTKADGDYFIPLPGAQSVEVTHYNGQTVQLAAGGKGINLRIAEYPILLTFKDAGTTLPASLDSSLISVAKIPDALIQGATADLTLRVSPGLAAAPELRGPPLWTISSPNSSKDADGATVLDYRVTVPADSAARRATFQFVGGPGDTDLRFEIPVKSRIEMNILPLAGEEGCNARVKLVLTNHSDQQQPVKWKAELVNQMSMENGTYNLEEAGPATAFFSGVAEDTGTLQPNETREIPLGLSQVDRLGIYRLRATAFDSTGNSVSRERLVGGFAKAARATGPVALDGSFDSKDWQSAPAYQLNEQRQFSVIVKGAKKWGGPQDLSGVLRFLWDDKYLYVGVQVTDDIFCNTKQDDQLWGGDGLQFLIDPYRQEVQGRGRYDYAMGHGLKGDEVWCHMSADVGTPVGEVKDILLTTKRLDAKTGNLNYVVAFPWQRLAPFHPVPGGDLGLGMIINEDDGEGRRSSMDWFEGVHLKETFFVGDVILGE
jgi:hypothetical protein